MVAVTKEKILAVARELFAAKGFEGTPIREIAAAADANVAAINYHFGSKQGLYRQVIQSNCQWMQERLEGIVDAEQMSTSEFVPLMLQVLVDEGAALMVGFKVMLDSSLPIESLADLNGPEDLGPPAGGLLLKIITAEVGEQVPLAARMWAVRMLFSVTVHMGLVMNTSVVKANLKSCGMSIEDMKRSLVFHAEAILDYIERKPERFQ